MSLRTETVSARFMANCSSPAEYLVAIEALMVQLHVEVSACGWQPLWDTLELSTEVTVVEDQMLVQEKAVRTSFRYLVGTMNAVRDE